jgi:hypothetical protein
MKKKFNTVAAALLLSLTMGMAGSAAAETASESEQKVDKTIPVSAVKSVPALALGRVYMATQTGFGLLSNPVHERNYLKLMVKAYAADSEQAWDEALEARKQAEAQFSKSLKIRLESALPGGQIPESETVVITKDKPLVGESTTKEVQVGDKKLHFTFIQKNIAETQNNPLGVPFQDGILHEEQAVTMEASPQAQLQGDFSKAVDAGDAAAIKELLPKLLEEYKQTTDKIIKSIEQQKQVQADATTEAAPPVEPSK